MRHVAFVLTIFASLALTGCGGCDRQVPPNAQNPVPAANKPEPAKLEKKRDPGLAFNDLYGVVYRIAEAQGNKDEFYARLQGRMTMQTLHAIGLTPKQIEECGYVVAEENVHVKDRHMFIIFSGKKPGEEPVTLGYPLPK